MKFKKYIKESLEDMDKRCPECNTLLNDMGTCPKCDDGEEDYGDDELKESCSDYRVKKCGAWWFGIIGPDNMFLKENNKLKLFKTKEAAEEFITTVCNEKTVNEELSVRDKLKAAYPELNFDKPTEVIEEELTNKEKLMRAFPGEFNFDTVLTEGAGSDTKAAIHDTMANLATDDKKKWASKAVEITDAIPDTFADELFDKIKEAFKNVRIGSADKDKLVTASDNTISEESVEDADTLGKILDAIDVTEWSKKNPEFIKGFVLTILAIVAVIEPTPVVEIITGIIALLPANVIAKIVSILNIVMNPVAAGIAAINNKKDDAVTEAVEKSNKQKLLDTYPELNFDRPTVETIHEDISSEDYDDYDDYYDIEDDVEADRLHTSLYGGDREYCNKCGAKLKRTEWGGYCSECDREENY